MKTKTFETENKGKYGKIKFDVIEGTNKLVFCGDTVKYYLADCGDILNLIDATEKQINALKGESRLFVAGWDVAEIKKDYFRDVEAEKRKEEYAKWNAERAEKRAEEMRKLQKDMDSKYTKEEQANMERTATSMIEGDEENDVVY